MKESAWVAPFALARPGDVMERSDRRVVRPTHRGNLVWGVEVDPATLRPRPDRTEGVLSSRPDPGRRSRRQQYESDDLFSARG